MRQQSKDVRSVSAGELETEIISVYDLLADSSLVIPQYQRPYKWTGKHIQQLFADIALHNGKSAYRLGTLVLHREGDQNNIVDGQQRTISLLLAARALMQQRKAKGIKRKDLLEQLDTLQRQMIAPSFDSEISQKNIHSNYREIERIVARADFDESLIDFFLNKCQVVKVVLANVSEAFQFFDSQNARGRDLEPHDLLKAYHLREFSERDASLKISTVAAWENAESQQLATLFAQYLYRIRNWSRGLAARYFTKEDAGLFKGVNLDNIAHYPYVEQLRITHHFVDHYNGQYERRIDGAVMDFPFQLDQQIINGRRFFEMIGHYQNQAQALNDDTWLACELLDSDGHAQDIIEVLNSYSARTRTGDRYVRSMFDCLLMYYIDKFGFTQLARAVEKIFIWAYSLRLQMQMVQLASMDNYVLENNLFRLIKDATRPEDFLNHSLPLLTVKKSNRTKELETLFKEMKYYAA